MQPGIPMVAVSSAREPALPRMPISKLSVEHLLCLILQTRHLMSVKSVLMPPLVSTNSLNAQKHLFRGVHERGRSRRQRGQPPARSTEPGSSSISSRLDGAASPIAPQRVSGRRLLRPWRSSAQAGIVASRDQLTGKSLRMRLAMASHLIALRRVRESRVWRPTL